MGGGHSSTIGRHIASMSGCKTSVPVKKGDTFHIVVNYDFEKNPGYSFITSIDYPILIGLAE